MAASNLLEDEITCSVCFDIYEDPHVLKECLHTYCFKCIKQLEVKGQIQCPDCRTTMKVDNIKKDFKTQRLIDIHKQEQTGSGVTCKREDKCGMCQNESMPITNHCTDCDIFLCASCSKVHQTNKALKSHKLMSVLILMKNIGSNLKETISKLENQVKNVDTKLKSVSQNLADVEIAKTQQIADIRKYTMEGIEDMKKNQKWLETLVNHANQTLVNHLHQSKKMLEEQKKDLTSNIGILKDLIKSQDIRTLQETAETVNETIKQDIRRIEETIERSNVNLKSPVTVEKNKNWDVKDSIEVSIDNVHLDSQQIGPVLETLYSELYTNTFYSKLREKTFTLTHTSDLSFLEYSLFMINNHLWCPGNYGCLNVFNLNCQPVKAIKLEQIICPQSVVAYGNEHVIVACYNEKGLHLLQSNGEYHSKITDGSFVDVDCYNGDVYAMDYDTCTIILLRRHGNKWSKIKSFKLNHHNGSTWDRLCVQRNGIYISSYINNCIYVYDKYGQFQYQRGEKGSDKPGQFKGPFLCDVDSDGNMLVADCENHRLQVCDSSGQWTVVKLPERVKYPIGVVLSGEGEMWIASELPNKLYKCKIS